MLPAVHTSTAPLVTAAHSHSPSPDLSPSPPSGFLATSSSSSHSLLDSNVPHIPHPSVIDDDARSDTSMPPLYDASDSESGEEPSHGNVYDFMSDSEADAHDVEMTLTLDDGNFSDSDGANYLLDDVVLPPLDTMATAEGNINHHVTVEEHQHLPHTGECAGLQLFLDFMSVNISFRCCTPVKGSKWPATWYIITRRIPITRPSTSILSTRSSTRSSTTTSSSPASSPTPTVSSPTSASASPNAAPCWDPASYFSWYARPSCTRPG